MIIHIPEYIFYCPFCGSKYDIEEGDNIKYCRHVQYAHIWCAADPDMFIYVSSEFGNRYIKKIKKENFYAECYVEDEEVEISDETLECFASGDFSAGDDISSAIPYSEGIAESVCSKNAILFKFDSTHSGFVFALDADVLSTEY